MQIHPVILAGGRGERFWPLSRRARPKQLLPLLSDRPMIADTLDRLEGLAAPRDAWILTARDLLDPVREAARGVPPSQIIGEPIGKNTAPAIALVARWLEGRDSQSVVVVLPSDHRVDPSNRFRADLERAALLALERSCIVVLGVRPTRPETGYGYIECGEPLAPGEAARQVASFREKPDAATAARYASDSRYLWNAGMFVFRPEVMLEEIRVHAPDIAAAVERVPRPDAPEIAEALERYYGAVPAVSIDVAVMERTRRAAVLPVQFEWDDVGSWASLAGKGLGAAPANAVRGRAILEDSEGIVAFAEGGLIAALGVRDLVIVRTKDVTLVCPKSRAQEVRVLVERLKRDRDGEPFL